MSAITFRQYLHTAFINGLWSTDEVVEFVLPLFEEVFSFHENSQVGAFENPDTIFLTAGRLDIDEAYTHAPSTNLPSLKDVLEFQQVKGYSITGRVLVEETAGEYQAKISNLEVQASDSTPITHPVYLPGYGCYELKLNHHDAQTDIFCLGLILGSVIMGLDLYNIKHLEEFASYRKQPAGKNPRMHATLCALVTEMTELNPVNRSRDLQEIIQRLKYYRDYDPQRQVDLSGLPELTAKQPADRREFILSKLRNRLFDTSRRNRLLYYKPNTRFANLTVSSVPMVLHFQSIKPESLFTWNKELAPMITAMKDISLNKYLRFEDHPYLNSQLNSIRLTAESDIKEYGFSQLKLVVAFLHWHNLKDDPNERIQTPFLLLPVKIKRVKSLKEERFILEIVDNAAVINPVLANYLKDLYGIALPDTIDFDDISMEDFFKLVKAKIDEAKQGVLLNYIDKPRIKLVHSIARQTVNNYKKKLKSKGGTGFRQIEYSYSEENYKPLGLELFRQKVEPKQSTLEFLLSDNVAPTPPAYFADDTAKSKSTFHLTDGESNPYSWDFDVCNMVLGNFNYKKMSLVGDYNKVAEQKINHPVFSELFSTSPRQPVQQSTTLHPGEWYHVITADPTQTKAILHSRKGSSYIIQGPPGTGKSQTITNLIADFLAQEKTILFVCEKRAALDVVYHRLQQNKLSELCCYIHDSQGDKKEFVKDLKAVYEDFVKNKMDLASIEQQRRSVLNQLLSAIELLKTYHESQKDTPVEAGINIRSLFDRLIVLKNYVPAINSADHQNLLNYKHWIEFGNVVEQLGKTLAETGAEPILAKHPFRNIGNALIQADNPFSLMSSLGEHVQATIQQITDIVTKNNIPSKHSDKLINIKNLIEDSIVLEILARSENLNLVEKTNPEAREFEALHDKFLQLQNDYEEMLKRNSNWQQKFSRQELSQAIAIADKHEKSFFKFLNGNWRTLKKQLNSAYNFSAHQLRPAFSDILNQLQSEYAKDDALQQQTKAIQSKYRITELEGTYAGIEALRLKQGDEEVDYLLQHPNANQLVLRLSKLNNTLHQLEVSLGQLLEGYENKSINQIQDELASITSNSEVLREMLPVLRQFSNLPTALKDTIRKVPITPRQAEAAMAHKTLSMIMEKKPAFARINDRSLQDAYATIENTYKRLLQLNSDFIRARRRQKFLSSYDISNTAAGLLTSEQKQFKKEYLEGRRVLEHEMSKSMRYKTIREMASNESGRVLKDIKPVWLMSPLSVSDSLPLDMRFFDVVIFDEASQITLEEGIPALFRAPQTIIVGDDKQMPPSNFFNAKSEDPNDLENFEGEREDEILSTEADSLLVQGARKLHSTMLTWHYRSRYESLISYSNHAFYDASLLTIPDKTIHHNEKAGIEVQSPEEGQKTAPVLLDGSISFHYLPTSVYEARSNLNEAKYIANIIRQLLLDEVQETIGIVAFSQEQQSIIEEAISQLAETDKPFDDALEKAYNRKDDGQFTGLFVKNLENVQGDERDIIIMSICYGHDAQKKIYMNFGPINRKGGEKRLNVIFSRAKKHMAIVSSIKHQHITNDYNEGANYLKRFLHYAEMVSTGNMQHARSILNSLVTTEKEIASKSSTVISQATADIKRELESAGYTVDEAVGQSSFKCTLGIKGKSDEITYRLGILVDDESHYNNDDLVEQYFQRPAILKSFGWNVLNVFAKDWLEDKQRVLKNVLQRLEGAAETEATPSLQEPSKESTHSWLGFTTLVSADQEYFWEVKQEGSKLVIRFGKKESKGQIEIKTCANEGEAQMIQKSLIEEKLLSGFKKK